MKVLFVSAEAAPFFKSGGLGDVAGSLPKELARQGIDIRVVLPLHTSLSEEYKSQLEDVTHFTVNVGWREQFCGIKKLIKNGITYYFIDNLQYFDREAIYGYDDDGERYSYFSMAVIEMLEKIGFIPDIIHANDWHTALIPVLLKDKYGWIRAYSDIKVVFSIHNIQFQGRFDQSVLSDWLGIGYNTFHERALEHFGDVNFMKGAIFYADHVTTVSPNYANEIQTQEFGYGLDGSLREVNWKFSGILNGLDYTINNPETDTIIEVNYSLNNLENKLLNKTFLQKEVGLPVDEEVMVIGMVSRLTSQKGFQLVQEAMDYLMQRNVQVVLVGTGEAEFENSFKYFNWAYPDKFKAIIDFDVKLAQQIYAGSDLFLMPSAFEPCGLSQMISMRYGTLPLVHEIGGLKDTVDPYNRETVAGTGFSFYDFTAGVMLNQIDQALAVFYVNPENWEQIMKNAMSKDFSWKKSTKQYMDIYNHLTF